MAIGQFTFTAATDTAVFVSWSSGDLPYPRSAYVPISLPDNRKLTNCSWNLYSVLLSIIASGIFTRTFFTTLWKWNSADKTEKLDPDNAN